jgi:holdfast attachment protein HfaA
MHQAMSFKRKGPGVFVSTIIGAVTGAALVGGMVALLTLPALAQPPSPAAQVSGEFERPFGYGYGEEQAAFDANTRDANGNRIILDGRIMTGMDQSTLSTVSGSAGAWAQATAGAGFGSGIASGTAVGNQLNVITQGNYNTVIVNSTQINNGNQTTVLNGKIDLQ